MKLIELLAVPKVLRGFIPVLCAFSLLALSATSATANAKYAAIIVDAETGQTLYARNADSRKYPASLTKIMTLYMVFDALERGKIKLNSRIRISRRAAGQPPSRLGLRPGQTISVKQAILALVTKSANDVAAAVAENLGGTEVNFAIQMTKKARELGMTRTTFRNASGLPNRRQLSTARDMVKLAKAIRKDFPQYFDFFSTRSFAYKGRRHRNHNKLLASYHGTDGIKTGYIRASGFNLVATVQRGNKRLIGVVFGGKTGKSRNRHMKKLLDRSFSKMRATQIATHNPPLPKARPSRSGKPVAVASAKAPTPTTTSAPAAASPNLTDAWGVQVGAYARESNARQSIARARVEIPKLLQGTEERVDRLRRKTGNIYRARLIGLDEGSARRACLALKKRKLPCIPVPGPDKVDVASAPQEKGKGQVN